MAKNNIVGLIPIDNRPVSLYQVSILAEAAGYELITPPEDLLGFRDVPGNCESILKWFDKNKHRAKGWIIALDMPIYGGLVASRKLDSNLSLIESRIEKLKSILTSCKVPVYAFQSIRRIADSVMTAEEITKWNKSHKEAKSSPERKRNHLINMKAIQLAADKAIDQLLLLKEDNRPGGPQLDEEIALRYKVSELKLSHRINISCGTDEGAMVLLSKFIRDTTALKPKVTIIYSSEIGSKQIPLYEDAPIRESVADQIRNAGLDEAAEYDIPDLTLFVWCPNRKQLDLVFDKPYNQAAIELDDFVSRIQVAQSLNKQIAIADLQYANGADNHLCERLIEKTIIPDSLYCGWNTASNTIGCALAGGSLTLTGLRFQNIRILDDWLYQSRVRKTLSEKYGALDIWNIPKDSVSEINEEAKRLLNSEISTYAIHLDTPPKIFCAWKRLFDFGITI